MRRINDAYQVIVEGLTTSSAAPRQAGSTSRRMSPEEIDVLANAIGSDGPVDWFLGAIGWVGNAIEGVVGVLVAIWLAVRVALGLWRRDFTVFREHPELVLLLLSLVFLAARELWLRSRISRGTSELMDS